MNKQEPHQQSTKSQECYQCQQFFTSNMMNFMAEFNAHICKQCYKIQSEQIMAYKKNKLILYPSIDQILPDLFLGNEDAATDINTFDSKGISAVCVCGDYLLTPFEDKFEYKKYEISDCIEQKIMHFFDENYEWITKMRQENKKVLIHCAAGVSRSASFVIAYLMKAERISYLQAYDFVKMKRPVIRPNSGFVQQLQQYEKYLFLNQLKIQEKKQE